MQWWQKWTLEKIKESATATVSILRHEMKQMEKRQEKKFDAKLEKAAHEIRSEMKEGFAKA
ncbi:hypothetical protein CJJ23_02745 [Mycoplasmopsis agassizii]|uniref:Uncharacterized protein n=1 Tax=Mycoplasmopsis agassizii TaxID=33922 RepID=A0A269TJG6_9BACT|nr:hypothetical protein [Mycoplasmopsis agassizii]PAK21330.1 hypothetical protein CJJ23_02745 [Mycoplasmopsis agassizii]